VSEYWGSVKETSNFIQSYICQSTGGMCRRQVTLYRVTCVTVLGECEKSSNFIQGYMCQSTGGVCMRQVTLYRVTCVRVMGECA